MFCFVNILASNIGSGASDIFNGRGEVDAVALLGHRGYNSVHLVEHSLGLLSLCSLRPMKNGGESTSVFIVTLFTQSSLKRLTFSVINVPKPKLRLPGHQISWVID